MADGFDDIFAQLRRIMLDAAPGMTISKDLPGSIELRTTTIDPKTRAAGWFGTVTVKKTYVAYHLMPLYDRPELAADISAALLKRKQGKTCFNFSRLDDALFRELDALTRACAAAISAA